MKKDTDHSQDHQAIQQFIDRFNVSWTQNKLDEMALLLHERCIFVAPDLKSEISGRPACLQTFQEYFEVARTHVFEIRNISIQLWGDTAIARLEYIVEYEIKNQLFFLFFV